jgi:hypothetical protein
MKYQRKTAAAVAADAAAMVAAVIPLAAPAPVQAAAPLPTSAHEESSSEEQDTVTYDPQSPIVPIAHLRRQERQSDFRSDAHHSDPPLVTHCTERSVATPFRSAPSSSLNPCVPRQLGERARHENVVRFYANVAVRKIPAVTSSQKAIDDRSEKRHARRRTARSRAKRDTQGEEKKLYAEEHHAALLLDRDIDGARRRMVLNESLSTTSRHHRVVAVKYTQDLVQEVKGTVRRDHLIGVNTSRVSFFDKPGRIQFCFAWRRYYAMIHMSSLTFSRVDLTLRVNDFHFDMMCRFLRLLCNIHRVDAERLNVVLYDALRSIALNDPPAVVPHTYSEQTDLNAIIRRIQRNLGLGDLTHRAFARAPRPHDLQWTLLLLPREVLTLLYYSQAAGHEQYTDIEIFDIAWKWSADRPQHRAHFAAIGDRPSRSEFSTFVRVANEGSRWAIIARRPPKIDTTRGLKYFFDAAVSKTQQERINERCRQELGMDTGYKTPLSPETPPSSSPPASLPSPASSSSSSDSPSPSPSPDHEDHLINTMVALHLDDHVTSTEYSTTRTMRLLPLVDTARLQGELDDEAPQ